MVVFANGNVVLDLRMTETTIIPTPFSDIEITFNVLNDSIEFGPGVCHLILIAS